MKILVINAGSSSLKYQLLDMENEKLKKTMSWLEILKGYADYILNDDIVIAISTQNVLMAVSSKSGRSTYIPLITG